MRITIKYHRHKTQNQCNVTPPIAHPQPSPAHHRIPSHPRPCMVEFRPTFAKINGLLNYEEVRVLLFMLYFQPHFLICCLLQTLTNYVFSSISDDSKHKLEFRNTTDRVSVCIIRCRLSSLSRTGTTIRDQRLNQAVVIS